MAGIRDLDTVLGKFSFDAVGDSVYNPIILFVENSKFETFEWAFIVGQNIWAINCTSKNLPSLNKEIRYQHESSDEIHDCNGD